MVASSSLASIDMTERDAGMLLRFHPRPAPSAAFRRGRGASHDRNANYPVAAISSVAAYALAAGNAMVLKPNEYTPGVSQWLVDRFAEVVPEQPVLQLVHGLGDTGAAPCRSGADKIAFIGSTATAKKVMATCAETLTPFVAECGGKDALIVDADAELDAMPGQLDTIRRHIADGLADGGRAALGGPTRCSRRTCGPRSWSTSPRTRPRYGRRRSARCWW